MIIGDSKEKLEPLLKKLIRINMFIHDSEHSYETMMYEFTTAWSYLGKNDILCSDDINHSKAFDEFIKLHNNEIDNLIKFEEIERSTDILFKRPFVSYLSKKT